MKKWGFLLLFLLCLGFAFINKALFFQDKVEIQKYDQNHKDNIDNIENIGTPLSIQKKEIAKEQIYQGNLLLINSKYSIRQESVKSDIVNLSKHNELINGYGLLNTNIYLSKGIAQKFSEMINDAVKEGVSHFFINSGYRDFDEQSVLYQEMGADYALPAGYSEHNLGLSLDVGSSLTKMDRAPEGKWLKENAWKYGFILRYPKDKTDVTGIQYEPWHIRYVGFPHSAIMKEKNFALEEYMDFLKEQKSITTTIDHQVYKIFYYPISQNTTIPVPANVQYEISGNNMDGVIVTVYSGKRD
ncbi:MULTISPECIES: VanY-A/VanY-F/VanY-M family D-Ala-D-Ala carboxypeptidase [Brevibacillus]|uniref:VanY-A/VanY-F/VanY-M family D-Ala-D-Ala carboxypeptidase n=1 Tax=Brevibacillus TaxID=55080 RepID=UPI000B9B868E|nr:MULTISPECIES: VanY-A/VanY-F/VanY-M family D-Ala-D-Ala carboxypeptidase [Brevibacillus]MED1788283.1 VanY-A/VanY-F/VanY-M family D-Ala-D-Ala carboxypeptidase [Brevibacillus laterosporus]RFB32082.1 VanY-A/VanY-F/VanY-M family D-Ala-D-Ala carboxypeptidase [Brevibacillus sp. VP]